MKITILTGPFSCLPPYSIGAVEKIWYSLGKKWELNNDICYVSKRPKNIKFEKKRNNIYINGYERSGSWIIDLVLDLIYSIKALKNAPQSDIVILNSIWSPVLFPFFRHKLKHALYNVARFPKYQLRYYSKIDCLACVSSSVYKAAITQSPQISAITCMIPNPIDTRIYRTKSKKKCSNMPCVIYAGRVHKEKGIDILVKAINFLNKQGLLIKLSIIGARDVSSGGSGETYVKELNSLAESFNINWIDPIFTSNQLADEISKGDIFCYPSIAEKGETFGVAPLEAMGLGLPTIVSDLDCFKDFVQDEKNGFIFNHRDKKSYVQVANIIEKIVQNKFLYESISTAGIETSRRYSIENVADAYYEVMRNIVANGKFKNQE